MCFMRTNATQPLVNEWNRNPTALGSHSLIRFIPQRTDTSTGPKSSVCWRPQKWDHDAAGLLLTSFPAQSCQCVTLTHPATFSKSKLASYLLMEFKPKSRNQHIPSRWLCFCHMLRGKERARESERKREEGCSYAYFPQSFWKCIITVVKYEHNSSCIL